MSGGPGSKPGETEKGVPVTSPTPGEGPADRGPRSRAYEARGQAQAMSDTWERLPTQVWEYRATSRHGDARCVASSFRRGITGLTSRSPVRQLLGGKQERVGSAAIGVDKVIH